MSVPPLAFFCITVLADVPDQLHQVHHRRIPPSTALLDALPHSRDPCLWAALVQLVHPLPPERHEFDLPLAHPALPLLQRIPDSPDFTLLTLVSLPNCTHLRDDDIASLRTLHRLLALDLRGCAISSYALIALARGLALPSRDAARSGTWGLRLLSLHGCPNIDNGALSALCKFPLLSAVDLRFTRCTPSAVNTHLSSLGFRSSDNASLFHPAPPSLALCTLEKVALSASDPISLYSCPPHSVFRVHVGELDHLPRPKKAVPVAGSSTTPEDTVVFIPPLRKPAKSGPSKPRVSTTPIDRPTHPNMVSNVASFYQNAPARDRHSRKSILPLSAQAVQSFNGGKLDPLAIARPPPPWSVLDNATSHPPHLAEDCLQSDNVPNPRQREPVARWTGQSLNKPLKVDRARLHRRDTDVVADMVHLFATKRPKIESEFAKARADVSVKPRNPFTRSPKSMFAQSTTNTPDEPQSSNEAEPPMQLRTCHSLPCKAMRQQGTDVERSVKPLKPITTLKPPILPKELLPPSIPKPKAELRQTRLSFSGEGCQGSVEHG